MTICCKEITLISNKIIFVYEAVNRWLENISESDSCSCLDVFSILTMYYKSEISVQ